MSDAPSSPTGTPLPSPHADTQPSPRPRGATPPNYAARRMLVTTIAITAIVAAAVVAWRFVASEDAPATGARGEWSEIALIDRSTGAITRLDPDGQLIETSVGLGRVTDVHVEGERLALVGPDRIVLAAPNVESVTIPIDRNSTVVPIRTDDGFHLGVGQPSGGNVLIVDATSGEILDVGALADQAAPLLFVETLRWSRDGSAFAVADAANFQTIVVRPGQPEAIFMPDQPVAIADGLVATSQVVGRQADIALLDFDRRNQAFVPTEIPAGGVLDDERLIMVSVDGGVYRVDKGADEADRMGAISVPTGASVGSVHPIADGQRLAVSGQVFQAIVDLEGSTIFTTSFASAMSIPAPDAGWTCLPVGGADSAHSVVDALTGEPLADLTGLAVVGASADGCAVLTERSGAFELIDGVRMLRLGSARDAVLAPDGRTIVWTTANGRTELVRVDEDGDELLLGESVDISARTSPNMVAVFIDR